ncbi:MULTISPECIES: aldehyde dehydrogenase family protein [unclassified Enterococcus]|uniref:aldehyde dehydrogenase family protein n=1 Tax=unclassified Enterococcus TaxID=2608891 RepID=UPI001CE15D1F|nr:MULTISPECIES: aldehyde dehydrogenase family protein [unclassified Enterococcus]MCA5011405.1 aldehyde dehydrogenase family protein [Enterococcus sp. S23]MCA5015153.1 aldehyde dehydrogenase family protein [Enterococcus sp. S22(2020)]
MQQIDKDLLSIQEARILVETARDAHYLIKDYGQKHFDQILKQLLEQIKPEISKFVASEMNETKLGNSKDKEALINQFLEALTEDLPKQQCIGALAKDSAGNILQVGVPVGVIPVILSNENVVLNTLYSLIIGIKSGNALVVIPHSNACKTTYQIVRKVKQICESNGLPKGCLTCLEKVTENSVQEVLNHQDTAMILVIGNSKYTNATTNQKPIIYGSSGATPVFIERSAAIQSAVNAIIQSRSFDGGLLPGAEQYLIAESVIASEVKTKMKQSGAHFLSKEEELKLLHLLQPKENQINPECIGKSAFWLAQKAGFSVDSQIKVLVSEQQYLHEEDPFTNEMKCPVLAFYLEPDWIHACEKSIRLLKEKNHGHSLAIHSQNTTILNEFALKKPVGRMIVNAPAGFASLGLNSNLPLSVILGGFTTGRGISAKNITAADLTYKRQISYPIQIAESTVTAEPVDKQLLEKVLRKILEK